ncbi:MAG: hypothetical protein U1F98_15065 [Verrucomicrobiota bacterium]
MKSAYELAMERLNKTAPTVALSADQKAQIADLESRYKAKIAEREIALQGDIDRAAASGDAEKADELRRLLAAERKSIQAELEEKKSAVRGRK